MDQRDTVTSADGSGSVVEDSLRSLAKRTAELVAEPREAKRAASGPHAADDVAFLAAAAAPVPAEAGGPPPPLTTAQVEAGLRVMHPQNGYIHLREPSGLVQPFDFDLAAVAELRARFALSPHDVIVATYPKCGTTWMQQVVLLLLRGSDTPLFSPFRDAPWLEMSASSAANGSKSSSPPVSVDQLCALPPPPASADCGRRVWKTHAPVEHVPWKGGATAIGPSGAKVILVARSSKDCAVSMLHHTKSIPPFGFTGGWEEFAPLFLAGDVESSSFWDFHAGWWEAHKQCPSNVMWVSFEQLKSDLPATIAAVASYLSLDMSTAEVAAVAARCSFDNMKDEAAVRDTAAEAKGEFVKKGHFREGRVGGWRAVMSDETAARFDERDAELAARCAGLRF